MCSERLQNMKSFWSHNRVRSRFEERKISEPGWDVLNFRLRSYHVLSYQTSFFFYPTNVNWQLDQTKKTQRSPAGDRTRVFRVHICRIEKERSLIRWNGPDRNEFSIWLCCLVKMDFLRILSKGIFLKNVWRSSAQAGMFLEILG